MGRIAGNSIPSRGTCMHQGTGAGNGVIHSIPLSNSAKLGFSVWHLVFGHLLGCPQGGQFHSFCEGVRLLFYRQWGAQKVVK